MNSNLKVLARLAIGAAALLSIAPFLNGVAVADEVPIWPPTELAAHFRVKEQDYLAVLNQVGNSSILEISCQDRVVLGPLDLNNQDARHITGSVVGISISPYTTDGPCADDFFLDLYTVDRNRWGEGLFRWEVTIEGGEILRLHEGHSTRKQVQLEEALKQCPRGYLMRRQSDGQYFCPD